MTFQQRLFPISTDSSAAGLLSFSRSCRTSRENNFTDLIAILVQSCSRLVRSVSIIFWRLLRNEKAGLSFRWSPAFCLVWNGLPNFYQVRFPAKSLRWPFVQRQNQTWNAVKLPKTAVFFVRAQKCTRKENDNRLLTKMQLFLGNTAFFPEKDRLRSALVSACSTQMLDRMSYLNMPKLTTG